MSARAINVQVPRVFHPLVPPARYKGAWGGRGSGKSRFFAQLLIIRAMQTPGLRAVCIREVQKTLKESSKRLIEDTIAMMGLGLADGFEVQNDVIKLPGGGQIIFHGMQDSNAESIKSLEGYNIAWIEEAQTLSTRSLALLRPTIRAPGSELWFSWNARRKTDPVDQLLRGDELPTDAVVVQANWRDNPFFPAVLEQERQDCLRLQPEQYGHVWEGDYASILVGAYYAACLNTARNERRIGRVAADPMMTVQLAFDIGGTGARADAATIWAFQLIGREIRVIDYYEAVGQPLATHINWMKSRGYEPGKVKLHLPHDGARHDYVHDASYESALRAAGYDVTIIPNQGKGAALKRVEVGRRMFPCMWFNEATTNAGLYSLGWYHERRDEARGVGLGPEHDFSADGADSFGLMAIVASDHFASDQNWQPIDYSAMDERADIRPLRRVMAITDEHGRPLQQWGRNRGLPIGVQDDWGSDVDYRRLDANRVA